ncbi:MAG: hypothetical protein BGO98_33410 [Myxococcales bacterium 68-20]|nr:hypothetical protein [Myxococcales bacterium]OJY22932.1 MAG: hypothetical protein BGO98_33410 [Myxococcales bacterium 68-20]
MSLHRLLALACGVGSVTLVGCSLLFATDDFAGGTPEGVPSQPPDDASTADVIQTTSEGAVDAGTEAGDADAGRPPARIYVMCGSSDGVNLREDGATSYAVVQGDGSLGAWKAGPPVPRPCLYGAAVVTDSFVAIAGGLLKGVGASGKFLVGPYDGGVITGFSESDSAFTPRQHLGAVMRGSHVFVMGGLDGPARGDVEHGELDVGSVGLFVAGPSLPSPLTRFATASSASNVYVVGGMDESSARRAEILTASFDGGGLAPFVPAGNLPSARNYARAVVYRNSLLVVGGLTGAGVSVDDVLVYPIDSSGNLGAVRKTKPLPATRNRHDIVVVDDRLYVLGGEAPGGGYSSDVFVGDLTPDGNVTAWRSTTTLPMPLVYHNAVVVR